MTSRRIVGSAVLVGIAALGIGYCVGRARASGVPATKALTYSGYVTDAAGVPASGSKSLVLQIFDAATAGVMKCALGPVAVTLGPGGFFQLTLPEDCTTAVHQTPDLWIEAFVGADSLGRVKLNAVPYALEAGAAASATGVLKTTLDTLAAEVASLKTSLAAGQTEIAALKKRFDLEVFYKSGNNATVSCDTFCQGSQWGTVGTCVGAKLANDVYVACAYNPGANLAGGLACWCSRPK